MTMVLIKNSQVFSKLNINIKNHEMNVNKMLKHKEF